ncbi:hypothetical protein EV175_003231, partial [Coemansia sp. RSA 1933]
MIPGKHNKVDMSSLSEEEKKNLQKYGRMPNRPLATHSRLRERKYFDSGDYALSKAGNKEVEVVGQDHPSPNSIPHYVSAASAAEQQPSGDGAAVVAGIPIVDTDSPTSTMVNPSCLATESSANTVTPPPEPQQQQTTSHVEPKPQFPPFGVLPAASKKDAGPMPFGGPSTTAPGNAQPPARPTFARRVSQVAGTQYR